MEDILEKIEIMRGHVNGKLEVRQKSNFGQYMTPVSIASFMASMFSFENSKQKINLLDPGSGIGILSVAFLHRYFSLGGSSAVVDSFEIDEIMRYFQEKTRQYCNDFFHQEWQPLQWNIIPNDFIESTYYRILNTYGVLEKSEFTSYTHCIMNPPYMKMMAHSRDSRFLRSLGVETPNYYAAFIVLAIKLLREGGELVAIIPRSFCNGVYFKNFRKFLLQTVAIRKIHVFKSRKSAFHDDNVLQENIILHLQKGGTNQEIEISTSTDQTFTDLRKKIFSFTDIISKNDSEKIIHIPDLLVNVEARNNFEFDTTLDELGIQISTGPVVDFRLKEFLRELPSEETVPLLYPCHFTHHKTEWPQYGGRKPNAILLTSETRKWLYPCGYYTVLRRFSTKEEKRRLIASTLEPEKLLATQNCEMIGFENHLNVFHINRGGLPEYLARGLTAFLNSSSIDLYFREFSGHTQVNASDIRRFRYPSKKYLIQLGKWIVTQSDVTQDDIDKQLLFLRENNNG